MTDIMTREERSALMSRIGSRNTKPEMRVRRLLHGLGYRYRIHRKDLPGCPDIVFVSKRKVIFVHGCFWHRHAGCKLAAEPKTRVGFWKNKFRKNVERDASAVAALVEMGWDVLTVWECETRDLEKLEGSLIAFLEP